MTRADELRALPRQAQQADRCHVRRAAVAAIVAATERLIHDIAHKFAAKSPHVDAADAAQEGFAILIGGDVIRYWNESLGFAPSTWITKCVWRGLMTWSEHRRNRPLPTEDDRERDGDVDGVGV